MQESLAASTPRRRFQTTLLSIFAGTALLLAETGVRIALGASRTRVIAMVVRQERHLVVCGLIV